MCTVEDIYCKIPGKNPFGHVTEGRLEITGPLLEVELTFKGEYNEFGIPKFVLSQEHTLEFLLFYPDTSLQFAQMNNKGLEYWTVCRTLKMPEPFVATVSCLWCFSADEEPSDMQTLLEKEVMKLHGIVIAPSDSSLPIYHRIGSISSPDMSLLEAAQIRKIRFI